MWNHAILTVYRVASIHLLLLLEAEETLSEETPLVKAANVCFEEMEAAEKAGYCRGKVIMYIEIAHTKQCHESDRT